MPLKGQAKKDYQREYMKRKRGLTVRPASSALDPVLDPNQDKLSALRAHVSNLMASTPTVADAEIVKAMETKEPCQDKRVYATV